MSERGSLAAARPAEQDTVLTPLVAAARRNGADAVAERLAGLRDWLAADRPTLADVAGYSYIAHAPEGGVSLAPYPQLRAWLARIEALPDFIGMARSPALA